MNAAPRARGASAAGEMSMRLLACAVALSPGGAQASVRTPGVKYRSIIGDPGMKWKPGSAAGTEPAPGAAWLQRPPAKQAPPAGKAQQALATAVEDAAGDGPRMQLFFYGLCSKAGYSNFSVLPSKSDTCETLPGQIIGFGATRTVKATDCCAACLAEPWCLAWTKLADGSCALKDNVLPQKTGLAPGKFAGLGQPVKGFCGQTTWSQSCNASGGGAWRASEHGIATLGQCEAMCESCSGCNYVSFSPSNDKTGDCSWYSSCELQVEGDYESSQIRNASNRPTLMSGIRRYKPSQELPSPRYGNCIVGGKQTISAEDNAAIGDPDVDAEWYAVQKEQQLAEKCAVTDTEAKMPSYFWTVMSQNGNAPSNVGTPAECLPYCYLQPPGGVSPDPPGQFGYPPVSPSLRALFSGSRALPHWGRVCCAANSEAVLCCGDRPSTRPAPAAPRPWNSWRLRIAAGSLTISHKIRCES